MCDETTSSRACGEGLALAFTGDGALGGICGVDWTLSLRSWDTCCPERMRGSGTLPVSRVCDTVVICARKGRSEVDGST
jgi:hypothetical protein